jgi:hypothetical protein
LCEDLSQSSCGDVLFYGYLPPPSMYIFAVWSVLLEVNVNHSWCSAYKNGCTNP